ncbi:hypothetical protein [Halorussus salinus]|uniref:hypothetical protein n=1 Tax=Halorussus salinus TaxID=1364935 RepID=UPI001091CD42|nr:hypothetical protein [Halorussus salinus]
MSPTNDSSPDSADMKQLRRQNPSAWLELTDNQTLPLVIDALLDSPPGREFNKKELGDHAGVSRESVRTYVDTLLKFNVVEEVPDTNPRRYRLNDEGKVTRALFELQSALNAEGAAATQDQRNVAPEGEE